MAAQAGLCLAWSETPEYTFYRVVAQPPISVGKSVAEQVSVCLAWSKTPEDIFSHGVAQLFLCVH